MPLRARFGYRSCSAGCRRDAIGRRLQARPRGYQRGTSDNARTSASIGASASVCGHSGRRHRGLRRPSRCSGAGARHKHRGVDGVGRCTTAACRVVRPECGYSSLDRSGGHTVDRFAAGVWRCSRPIGRGLPVLCEGWLVQVWRCLQTQPRVGTQNGHGASCSGDRGTTRRCVPVFRKGSVVPVWRRLSVCAHRSGRSPLTPRDTLSDTAPARALHVFRKIWLVQVR
mmetsp:Transcript_45737/g.126912  ORF Transcript_45737/g.126912 Transcript_45737/m.126912 type:complete len:227 (-) Transcript_45737:631-1311(-)